MHFRMPSIFVLIRERWAKGIGEINNAGVLRASVPHEHITHSASHWAIMNYIFELGRVDVISFRVVKFSSAAIPRIAVMT